MVRRVIIASIFLSFNAIVILSVYFLFLKPVETCFDGKENQDEQGIDCGGICALACVEVVTGRDFEQKEVAFVPAGNGRYDVLAKIYNSNDTIGATAFSYTFELLDKSGQVLATRTGTNYILPQETKTILELNLVTSSQPSRAQLRVTGVTWERLSGYRERPAVNIYEKRYGLTTAGFGYSEAFGLLSNESPYDFRSIIVKVILRDSAGRPVAMNTHEMRTVTAKESRDFKLVWPLPFAGEVAEIDMEVDADVYHSENFIQQYFPGGEIR
jgi:hypothetical protein